MAGQRLFSGGSVAVLAGLSLGLSALPGAGGSAWGQLTLIPVEVEINGNPVVVQRLFPANVLPAFVLGQMDIDGDGIPDNSPDTDGDGLPDSWETGGIESPTSAGLIVDRVVPFSRPTAIVPGGTPQPLFSRVPVQTSALSADTDADGLTDFVEVFGLKFIDDNNNGRLDFVYTDLNGNGRWDPGEPIDPASGWMDLNGDGMPSIGEWPLYNQLFTPDGIPVVGDNDYDGFCFTDPTNPDTDGDGIPDGIDPDPLINPRAFGARTTSPSIIRGPLDQGDQDFDNDGLGNSQDLLNDVTGLVDNPTDLREILALFRPQDLDVSPVTVAEAQIEDLLGIDWDGNGLWRTTDVQDFTLVIADPALRFPGDPLETPALFEVGTVKLYAPQSFAEVQSRWAADISYTRRGMGMGYQSLLRPPARNANVFISDPRIWTVLYAWRMPGIDLDGNGFIGVPSVSTTQTSVTGQRPALVNNAVQLVDAGNVTAQPIDQRFPIAPPRPPGLDGIIEASPLFANLNCGAISCGGMSLLSLGLLGLVSLLPLRRRWLRRT